MTEVSLKVNGEEVRAERRSPLLGAIRSLGIEVPTLCHLEGMEPYGVCRLCIVELKQGGRTRLVTSCNYPAEEGLEVFTDTERVRARRRMLAELLLARCPEVEQVRRLAKRLGVETSRFASVDPTDCVLCGLCVRVCDQYVGASALGFMGRGSQRVVGTPWSVDPDSCIACGACTWVCPTGAMKMEAKTKERWRRELASDQRLCRYARMGWISYKICPNDFMCKDCEVDQRFVEELGTHPLLALAPGLRRQPKRVGPFDVVEDRFYSRGHAWVRPTGDRARVGLDDFAQKLVGTARQVTLHAAPGAEFERGEPAAIVASNGRKAPLRFPISGTVLHHNQAVLGDPELVNQDSYDRGWLYVVRPRDLYDDARSLVSGEEVGSWIEEESARLARALEGHDIHVLSDEGGLQPGFAEEIGGLQFVRLDTEFLAGDRGSR